MVPSLSAMFLANTRMHVPLEHVTEKVISESVTLIEINPLGL